MQYINHFFLGKRHLDVNTASHNDAKKEEKNEVYRE